MRILAEFDITHCIRYFTISKPQKPIYWEWDGDTIFAGKKRKPLLKMFVNIPRGQRIEGGFNPYHLADKYRIAIVIGDTIKVLPKFSQHRTIEYVKDLMVSLWGFTKTDTKKAKFYVFNNYTNKLVISNEKQVGIPKRQAINGQLLYAGMFGHTRHNMMTQIKECFYNHIKDYIKDIQPVRMESCPIILLCELYEYIPLGANWDLKNRLLPFTKGFADLLVTGETGAVDENKNRIKYFNGILPDDTVNIINEETIVVHKIPFEQSDATYMRLVFRLIQRENQK